MCITARASVQELTGSTSAHLYTFCVSSRIAFVMTKESVKKNGARIKSSNGTSRRQIQARGSVVKVNATRMMMMIQIATSLPAGERASCRWRGSSELNLHTSIIFNKSMWRACVAACCAAFLLLQSRSKADEPSPIAHANLRARTLVMFGLRTML